MLHGVSTKLSRLNDVAEIGATIADELRLLIDYHNCRVFVREGDDLRPIAFRGDLAASGSAMEVLATRVGDGITGHVAATGEPFLTGNAAHCDIGVRIPGTDEIEESLLAVPFLYGQTVVGVIVVSKLGLDQFDADDLRLLEVLAGHVSVALVNARLYEAQRREAESAKALLELTRELSAVTNLDGVLEQVVRATARIMGSRRCSVWLPTVRRRARLPRDRGRRRRTSALQWTRCWRATWSPAARPAASRSCMSAGEAALVARALEGEKELASPHAVSFIPLDQGARGARRRDRVGRRGARPRAAGGHREPGAAGDHERGQLRDPRADLPLDGRGARERARGEGLVHVVAHAVDLRQRGRGRPRARARRRAAQAPRARRAVPRHREDRDPGLDPHEAGPARRRRAVADRAAPELGERILAPIDQLAEVRPIVRACHERYDGSGYPDGLTGDEIPLEARIIFACDAFHAMTTDRPYREALPVEEAFRRLAGRRRVAVRSARRGRLRARADAAAAARRADLSRRAAARGAPVPRRAPPPAPRRPCRSAASSGSAVQSSCAQRLPKRAGGRTNVTGSRHALKRTMNDSSSIGSPALVERRDLVAVQERAEREGVARAPSRRASSCDRPGGTTRRPARPSPAAPRP